MARYGRPTAFTEDSRFRRRRAVASLLVFANELERTRRISKASKGLLKELIVHENEQVMSVGEALSSMTALQAAGLPGVRALETLEGLIKKRANKSHEELFEICPLEEAHLLSQEDTEALAEGSDTKSLVYGEVDFWSFYDVIRTAVEGINVGIAEERGSSIDSHGSNSIDATVTPACNSRSNNGMARSNNGGESARSEPGVAKERKRQSVKSEKAQEMGMGAGCLPGAHGSKQHWKEKPTRVRAGERRAEKMAAALAGDRTGAGKGLKFYDLGSGSGKAVFAAVLAVDFRCAVGIEVLAGVYEASKRVLRRYRRLVEPVLSSPALVKLYHGSFLAPEFDWSDGDVVFANSTCFAEDTLLAIAAKATALRPGARVVTFTTALKTAWLRVLLKQRYMMSWGPATVFVHQKLSRDEYLKRVQEATPYDEDQGLSRTETEARVVPPTNQVSPPTLTLSAREAVAGVTSSDEVFDSHNGRGSGFSRHADIGEQNGFYVSGERDAVDWDPCSPGPQLPMRC